MTNILLEAKETLRATRATKQRKGEPSPSECIYKVYVVKNMDPGYWELLPSEILEKILLNIPTYQLPFKDSWVCKRWTRIILQPRYWVQKLKRYGISIDEKIWSVLQDFEGNCISSCLYFASLYQEYINQQIPCHYYYARKCPIKSQTLISNFILKLPPNEESGRILRQKKIWIISDDTYNILMASGILVCKSYWLVYLFLKKDYNKYVTILLKLLVVRKVALSVRDDYGFWNFSPRINYLHILSGSCIEERALQDFRGCLTTLEEIPPAIGRIMLSIGVDDQNIAIDPGLSRISQHRQVTLHFKAGTDISNLPRMIFKHFVTIIVSCLEESHVLWMTELAKKFLINVRFRLIFFKYRLDLISSEHLWKSLSKTGLELENQILCSSSNLNPKSKIALNELAHTHWPNFCGWIYDEDAFLWFDCDEYLLIHLWICYKVALRVDKENIDQDFIDYQSGEICYL